MQLIIIFFSFLTIGYAQLDTSCENVYCTTGYRCQKGICVRQIYSPKKKLCASDQTLTSIKCTNRGYDCSKAKPLASCGYSSMGVQKDFDNDCLPCLDSTINVYVRQSCIKAPTLCNQNQECVNGKCMQMFTNSKYKDNVSCSSSSQCRPIVEVCLAGKCVKMIDAVKQLQNKFPK